MSDTALHEFQQARTRQHDRNEARRMRALVNQARGDTHVAGARWPFELIQNAHDPGAREGNTDVDIDLIFDGQLVQYEHNGKLFTMQDLAALLSGGSSKEFDSTETTGRFGTGFLVTHVLSPRISFTGLLASSAGPEEVSIGLDRAGDEEEIFENTNRCYEAIGAATKLAAIDGRKTARFQYQTDNPEAARIGIATLFESIPYLYGTCEHLGIVHLGDSVGSRWRFVPEPAVERQFMGKHLRWREFTLAGADTRPRRFAAIRLRSRYESSSGLVTVVELVDQCWRLHIPSSTFPRIFVRFPIHLSDFLPINVVIDGRFDLRQERDRVLMKEEDKAQISDAVRLLPTLVQFSINEQWIDGHKLARVGMPERAFGDSLDDQGGLRDWWRGELGNVAREIAQLPVIDTAAGRLKASGTTPVATFVVPRFALREGGDEIEFGRIWEVLNQIRNVHPPIREIAADWSTIASEWADLGVAVSRMALSEIADAVREGSTKLDDLKVTSEPLSWLKRYLQLVAQVAGQHNCATILAKLLPDQNRDLTSPQKLARDTGISEPLKEIARIIGSDIRSKLLLPDVTEGNADPISEDIRRLIEEQVTLALGEGDVIKKLIEELNRQLPDNKAIGETNIICANASIDLLKYLWEKSGADAASLAQQCPLITAGGKAIRWSIQRKALAPVSAWHVSAQPFSNLYEDDRILAEEYVTRVGGAQTLVMALSKWGMAYPDPLCTDSPRELRDERLKAITAEGADSSNVIVSDCPLSQIALLPKELIQRCQSNEELAKLLLGITLKYIAVNDSAWREVREVSAKRNRTDSAINIRPALWLGDLRTKAWVPVHSERDGQQVVQPVVADAGNLRPLLDPKWLIGNDSAVELLSRFFGFNVLELMLLSTDISEGDREKVQGELAKIVQTFGGDLSKYGQLAADLTAQQQREEQKDRNRRFGLAVQRAIESYLEKRGLHLKLIDRGYDYDLSLEAPLLDSGTHHFRLADYFLEVKATTTGEVRLTPLQAQMASEQTERFVLCVVDLRGVTPDRLEREWTAEDVEPLARMLMQVGALVGESHHFVEQAKGCKVGIRNDSALRYGIPVAVWEEGTMVPSWIDGLPLQPTGASDGTL